MPAVARVSGVFSGVITLKTHLKSFCVELICICDTRTRTPLMLAGWLLPVLLVPVLLVLLLSQLLCLCRNKARQPYVYNYIRIA